MTTPEQLKSMRKVINQFNEEVEEGIKHLLGTAGIDPYDLEDKKLTVPEAQKELAEKGIRIINLRNPLAPQEVHLLLFKKEDFLAGVRVYMNTQKMTIHRQMMAAEDDTVSEYAQKFIRAMK